MLNNKLLCLQESDINLDHSYMKTLEEIFKGIFIAVLIGGVFWNLLQHSLMLFEAKSDVIQIQKENTNVLEKIAVLKSQVQGLNSDINFLTNVSSETKSALDSQKINKRIKDSNSEINKIKEYVSATPEKAIALEQLKTQIRHNRELSEVKFVSLESKIDFLTNLLFACVSILIALGVYVFRNSSKRNVPNKGRES